MAYHKSSDDPHLEIIVRLLHDVANIHGVVFTPRALQLTERKLRKRYAREGIGLLTKTLPRLGKALDRALTGEQQLDCGRERKLPGTELPRFLGELFRLLFNDGGWVLPPPDKADYEGLKLRVSCVRLLRQILVPFYKLELPHSSKLEQEVLTNFEKVDDELKIHNRSCGSISCCPSADHWCQTGFHTCGSPETRAVAERARKYLEKLFTGFDPKDITPRHGPGSVSTKERGPGKYQWTCVPDRLTNEYPLDEYFYASLGHVCDEYRNFEKISGGELRAKVILVPKDSRGPRIISEESLPMQYIQQGLMSAIVDRVEKHPLTRDAVHFTDQSPNQMGALLGSRHTAFCRTSPNGTWPSHLRNGLYSTLDLKEASDRVSIGLVHLLFPEHLKRVLMSTRSRETVLPNGKIITLQKFAPMGSALCFPILALSIWSILAAGAPDADVRKHILVYGDDVVVPTDYAEQATKLLELFGLKVNRDKSCTKGFFRESCGVDAYLGKPVTPVRFRTAWTHHRSPKVYSAYIAYANALYDRRLFATYNYIVENLTRTYGWIPDASHQLKCLHLRDNPWNQCAPRTKWSSRYQKRMYHVLDVVSVPYKHELSGWQMLLRYFTEGSRGTTHTARARIQETLTSSRKDAWLPLNRETTHEEREAFQVRSYTDRDTSKLVRRWR